MICQWNIITIKVTQVLEEAIPETETTEAVEAVTEETTYTLVVYKNPINTTEISNFNEITGDNDYVLSTLDQGNHTIPKDIITILTDNKKTLYYNVINMYNGLLYQVKLPSNITPSDINLQLTKVDSGYIEYSSNLPNNTELTIYLEQNYEDGESVQIYAYNEGEEYDLVTAGLEVKNGYISFKTNGKTNYIITTADLIVTKSEADKLINIIKKVLIITAVLILIIILVPKLLKKKTKTEETKEPLY